MPNNNEKKLEEILQRLEKIERIVDPPFYKRFLSWCFRHLVLIVITGFLAYFTWKIWGIIAHLQMNYETLINFVVENTNAVRNEISNLPQKLDIFDLW